MISVTSLLYPFCSLLMLFLEVALILTLFITPELKLVLLNSGFSSWLSFF